MEGYQSFSLQCHFLFLVFVSVYMQAQGFFSPLFPSICFIFFFFTDLLLFGNKRAVEPIKSVPVSALDATLGSMVPKDVRSTTDDAGPRFLDTYSEADLRGFFSSFHFETGRYVGKNFNEMFAQLGFTHLIFSIDVSDNFVHRVSLYDTKQCPENLLAQFVSIFFPSPPFFFVYVSCAVDGTDSLSGEKQLSVFSTQRNLIQRQLEFLSTMPMALTKVSHICTNTSVGLMERSVQVTEAMLDGHHLHGSERADWMKTRI